MRKVFNNRLEAIDWIAENTENEGQFEVMREQLNFNYIYTERYYIDTGKSIQEVVLLGNDKEK